MNNTTNKLCLKWKCPVCHHQNETQPPFSNLIAVCYECEKSTDATKIEINASTYLGCEEITVTLQELIILDKSRVDDGLSLNEVMIDTLVNPPKFLDVYPDGDVNLVPDDKLLAYLGAFWEYVPIVID